MIAEAHLIAARLAGASEVFPIWDSTARVTANGDVITVVVTDHMGRSKREYQAVIQCVAEDARTPAR